VEEEDENEGTVMGASEEVEEDKPPTTSILDEMFGALTMPSGEFMTPFLVVRIFELLS